MPPTLPNTLTHILAEFPSNSVISILKDIFQYIPKPVNRQRTWYIHVENTLQLYYERMFFQAPPFGLEEALPQLFKVHGSCILNRNHKQLKGSWARGVQYEWILYTESSEWTDWIISCKYTLRQWVERFAVHTIMFLLHSVTSSSEQNIQALYIRLTTQKLIMYNAVMTSWLFRWVSLSFNVLLKR